MSKAFTKEDDAGGVEVPTSASFVVPPGPFRLTAHGAVLLARAAESDARLRDAFARAEVLPALEVTPEVAALGVTVVVENGSGEARQYRLVSPEERALVGDGCSLQSPLGRALLGGRVGETREVSTPRGAEELTITALVGAE